MMHLLSDHDSDNEISLLICDFMGIYIGFDMAQVAEICDVDMVRKKGIVFYYLHEKINNFRGEVEYKTPRVLVAENNGTPKGIAVNMPSEMVSVPTTSIRPLPGLIELYEDTTPVWGVVLWKNSIVLLFNLQRLFESGKI